MFWKIVKVTSNKSRHVINIPAEMARETGIDKVNHVIITKSGKKKLEIKRYDSERDIAEYIQDQVNELDREEYNGKEKRKA